MSNDQCTKESVEKFIADHTPINTRGALNHYPLIVPKLMEDGDEYYRCTLPWWWMNRAVSVDVMRFASDALTQGATVYLREGEFIVDFYVHCCDPD